MCVTAVSIPSPVPPSTGPTCRIPISTACSLFESYLFGVPGSDPLTLTVVPLTVLMTILAAGFLPARRLVRLEPARILSEE